MSELHPSLETFEDYLDGALVDCAAFETHVAQCATCAARLQQEARLDMALFETVEAKSMNVIDFKQSTRVRRFRAPAWIGVFAAAALYFIVLPERPEEQHAAYTSWDAPVEAPDFARQEQHFYPRYPDGPAVGLTLGERQ